MVPTSRCTIYRGTFIGACLFSEFRNTSGNGVPSPWITDSAARAAVYGDRAREGGREGGGEGEGRAVDGADGTTRQRWKENEAGDCDYRRRGRKEKK